LAATDAAHKGIHNGNNNVRTVAASSHPITPVDALVGGSGAGSRVYQLICNLQFLRYVQELIMLLWKVV